MKRGRLSTTEILACSSKVTLELAAAGLSYDDRLGVMLTALVALARVSGVEDREVLFNVRRALRQNR